MKKYLNLFFATLLISCLFVTAVGQRPSIKPIYTKLNDLLDVNVPNPTNNFAVTWDSTTAKWIAEAPVPAAHVHAAGDITSGTLPVARGGTNLGSYAIGDIIHATGTGTLAGLADVAVGSVLVSGGVNTIATWSASPAITTSVTVPSVYGSTASGGSLNLYSTSHSTKGYVVAQDPISVPAIGRNLKTWWHFEDFRHGTSAIAGNWQTNFNGTDASASIIASTAQRLGIRRLSTGTDTSGRSAITLTSSFTDFLFGGGVYTIEADIYVTTLSDGADTYALRFGFGDTVTGNFTDGAHFEYLSTTSANWYKCTANTAVRTKNDTSIAVVAGAWTRLKVVVNADATSVEYFINGVSAGTETTNIPTGTGRETGAILSFIKSAGTTARTVDIDWAWIHVDLTTSR